MCSVSDVSQALRGVCQQLFGSAEAEAAIGDRYTVA